MKKVQYKGRPAKTSEMSFQDLYEEISENWRQKADRLQARRRRVMRRALQDRRNASRI